MDRQTDRQADRQTDRYFIHPNEKFTRTCCCLPKLDLHIYKIVNIISLKTSLWSLELPVQDHNEYSELWALSPPVPYGGEGRVGYSEARGGQPG